VHTAALCRTAVRAILPRGLFFAKTAYRGSDQEPGLFRPVLYHTYPQFQQPPATRIGCFSAQEQVMTHQFRISPTYYIFIIYSPCKPSRGPKPIHVFERQFSAATLFFSKFDRMITSARWGPSAEPGPRNVRRESCQTPAAKLLPQSIPQADKAPPLLT